MVFFWLLLVGVGAMALFFMGARMTGGGRERVGATGRQEARGGQDLGANVNPSQTGNLRDLWPDRTGARTRRELGARETPDMTFTGDREEHSANVRRSGPQEREPGEAHGRESGKATAHGVGAGAGPAAVGAGAEPEAVGAGAEAGGLEVGAQAGGDGPGLDREAAYGEDHPANRTDPPDQPPTQWHPRDHGVPGDHVRNGDHRSATAPERKSDTSDPYAHAPVPGPNQIPPEGGIDVTDGPRP